MPAPPYSPRHWQIRDHQLHFSAGPMLVGILNTTPDSFSDGGSHPNLQRALQHAQTLLHQGAHILDIGGESTRPGATPVHPDTEIQRTIPLIRALRQAHPQAILSLDTRKAAVAAAGLQAGAHIINDISTLADPDMAATIAQHQAGLVLSHLRGQPATMQEHIHFLDPIEEIRAELSQAATRATQAGIHPHQIVLDPGIGFGKTSAQNWHILNHLNQLRWQDRPLFVGSSRKGLYRDILPQSSPQQRDTLTALTTQHLAQQGIELIRVHNPALNQQAIHHHQLLQKNHPLQQALPK